MTTRNSMEDSLYNRIFQRVQSETNNDEQFSGYLAEICVDENSHCDDLRNIIDTMFKTTYPNISKTRREQIVYSIIDLVEDHREQETKGNQVEEDEDDIDLAEKVERDGECKLCGSNQRITIHHMIPKLILKRMRNSGKESVDVAKYLVEVCRPCHNEIHRIWPHTELAKEYQTVDMILEAPAIQPYLKWKRKRERTA